MLKTSTNPKTSPPKNPNRRVLGCPLQIQFYLEIFTICPNNSLKSQISSLMLFPSFLEDILQKESKIIEILIESLKNMDFIILLAIIKHIFYYSTLFAIHFGKIPNL